MENKTSNAPPKLVIRRVIHAKRDNVFAAWTKPEIMSKWFFPGDGKAVIWSDVRVGGHFENQMTVGKEKGAQPGCGTNSETDTHLHSGEYLEITPPSKIVFTWNSAIVSNSRVTVELRDLGNDTELTLTHELLDTEDLRQQHLNGWEGCLLNLGKLLG